jgi:hypothetical protein
MPLRFDDTKIPGLFSTDGYLWIGDRSPEDIAERILERWRLNSGEPAAPVAKPPTDPGPPIEPKWTDELRIYGEGFVGRQDELAALDRAWTEGARIFALHAEGGAGKTRVVVEWLRRMRDAGWRGARRVFVHSFYSQGSDERRNATSELFFEQALAYFGYRGEPILQADEKGRTLARLLVEHGDSYLGTSELFHGTDDSFHGTSNSFPGTSRLFHGSTWLVPRNWRLVPRYEQAVPRNRRLVRRRSERSRVPDAGETVRVHVGGVEEQPFQERGVGRFLARFQGYFSGTSRVPFRSVRRLYCWTSFSPISRPLPAWVRMTTEPPKPPPVMRAP